MDGFGHLRPEHSLPSPRRGAKYKHPADGLLISPSDRCPPTATACSNTPTPDDCLRLSHQTLPIEIRQRHRVMYNLFRCPLYTDGLTMHFNSHGIRTTYDKSSSQKCARSRVSRRCTARHKSVQNPKPTGKGIMSCPRLSSGFRSNIYFAALIQCHTTDPRGSVSRRRQIFHPIDSLSPTSPIWIALGV
jgi:hypothetical protein